MSKEAKDVLCCSLSGRKRTAKEMARTLERSPAETCRRAAVVEGIECCCW